MVMVMVQSRASMEMLMTLNLVFCEGGTLGRIHQGDVPSPTDLAMFSLGRMLVTVTWDCCQCQMSDVGVIVIFHCDAVTDKIFVTEMAGNP
jgi:hypothetical protein